MILQKRLAEIVAMKYQLYPRNPDVTALLNSLFCDEVMRIYQKLGGRLPMYPIDIGDYDISVNDFDIELDECLHFNRYRQLTLTSGIYGELSKLPVELYRSWCKFEENRCLRAGRYGNKWSTLSADRQFGESNNSGDFSENGSSRWKQRAFNDYRKDVLSLLENHRPLVRISIYDKIGEFTVEQMLQSTGYMNYAKPIFDLIDGRSSNTKT